MWPCEESVFVFHAEHVNPFMPGVPYVEYHMNRWYFLIYFKNRSRILKIFEVEF